MMHHYPDLVSVSDWLKQISHMGRPLRSTTLIWVVTRDEFSALGPQTSFCVEIIRWCCKMAAGNNTVEFPCGTIFKKQPPIKNTKVLTVKALQLKPLVNDHLL